ncbi:efflux RND transporter periplasmic adaptor subunit [Beggiatoa leptomitoformis]|uniref:Efflux RND transporter periplasmic adaptor subunit n=1 Tax=Beggiatoa leptomitoformis TaxID=288004 RepID=A0A2N9YI64_9GAMM|nr:efflux RND transporter periplasmic adaptor subunit [Beggiatoa leptomitoformis]ALG69389.2 efflux RND transporter periplasmic adaptor subunit [Beggiatoa leptomitoformis]AUI70207.1 efflux RND transporter periplasmic adaptor subunit [Beggiatoa leptomitoformis]
MSSYRYFLISLLGISALISPFSNAQQPPPAMPVEATPVQVDTVIIDATAIGTLKAEESVVIRSELDGRIQTLHVMEGQTVEKGKPLVVLDDSEYRAQLAESAATVNLNALNFERSKDMLNKNLGSRQTYDEAKAKLDESRARQSLIQVSLDKTRIPAPFSGILSLRNISEGAYIKAGEDLVTLVDINTIKIDFRVSERYLTQIKSGQAVNLRVDAYPNEVFQGQLYASDPRVDEDTRTILLRARVANPARKLLPGMFARVSLLLEERKNAIVIPEQAIVPQGNDSFVFKLVDNKAQLTKVILGKRRTGDVEVVEGLTTSDVVVTDGQIKLRNGADVRVITKPVAEKPTAAPAKPAS